MEALASLREKERVGAGKRQFTRDGGIGDDVAIAQLGQNHFERLAESVKHANRVLQWQDGIVERSIVMAFIGDERELGL